MQVEVGYGDLVHVDVEVEDGDLLEVGVGDGDLVVDLVERRQLKRWRDQTLLSHREDSPPLFQTVTSVCGADESEQHHGLVVDLSGHHRVVGECGGRSGAGEVCGDARSLQVAPRGVDCGG